MIGFINAPRQDFMENEFGFLWISDGILFMQYKPIIINAEIVNEAIDWKFKICKGRSYPALIDGRQIKYWTLEARKVSFNHKDSFTNLTASALINSSPMGNAVVNWVLRFMKCPIPIKQFATPDQGIQWLQQFK